MYRNLLISGSALGFVASLAGVEKDTPLPALTAAQVADRNVAGQGGLDRSRAVKTMSLAGKLGVGGNQRSTLPGRPVRINSKVVLNPKFDEALFAKPEAGALVEHPVNTLGYLLRSKDASSSTWYSPSRIGVGQRGRQGGESMSG
jgi:hypothetical protein